MAIGIGENLGKSFGFTKESLVGKWLNWLLLIVLTIIPILDIIALGIYLRIFRGEKPEVNNIGKAFIDGLLLVIITLIYVIIPAIILVLISGLGIVGTIIGVILMFLVCLIYIPASYNFANKGFGAAFAFGDIFAKIGKIGWVQYLLAVIVMSIIIGIFTIVLPMIPIVGAILMIIFLPAVCILSNKFYANLFA